MRNDRGLPLEPDHGGPDEGHSPHIPDLPSFQLTTPPPPPPSDASRHRLVPASPSIASAQLSSRDHDWSSARLSLPMPHSTSGHVQQWTPPGLLGTHDPNHSHTLATTSHGQSSSYNHSQEVSIADWSDPQSAIVPVHNIVHRTTSHRPLVLEEILPRDTAVYMVSLYFDYVGRVPRGSGLARLRALG